MREIESQAYNKWDELWSRWKEHKLVSPLEELVTYDNCMVHGHLYYFKEIGNHDKIQHNMDVLKDFLPRNFYRNLKKAYKIFKENETDINAGKFNEGLKLEDLFLKVDEFYYKRNYVVLGVIMWELELPSCFEGTIRL